MRLKPLIFWTVAACALSASAHSADMAVKAPLPMPVSLYNWTGFYVGGNVGYSWGSASSDYAFAQSDIGVPPWTFNGNERKHLDGVIGGAQAGYNWQAGIYLFGIEADIQGSAEKHTGIFAGILPNPGGPVFFVGNDPITATETNKIDWFGTVRGRIGATSNHWLFHATGGLAYGRVNSSGIFQPATAFADLPNSPFVWNNSAIQIGWTIGAGIENSFFGNWSWRIEYLYMDLGRLNTTVSGGLNNCYGAPGGPCNGPLGPGTLSVTSRFTDNIVRVGLNYKLN